MLKHVKFVLFPLISSVAPAFAANTADIKQWGTVIVENDAFSVIEKSDNDYSNGMGYEWGYTHYNRFQSIEMPSFLRSLLAWTYVNQDAENQYALDYAVIQGIYTPDDLSASELIEDDRPYSGTLTWSGDLRSFDGKRSRSLALTLGVVGPLSLAEPSQKVLHRAISANEPKGWENQLHNEPVFRVDGEYLYRLYDSDSESSSGFDLIFYSEAGAGNLKSDLGAGLILRIGNSLDETYAYMNPIPTRYTNLAGVSPHRLNWLVYLAGYGQHVFNDITIDGNTFKDSHSVELIHRQAFASFGFALRRAHWGFSFSTQNGSKQYEEQRSRSNFSSVNVTYYY